jgi:hypothetical protein
VSDLTATMQVRESKDAFGIDKIERRNVVEVFTFDNSTEASLCLHARVLALMRISHTVVGSLIAATQRGRRQQAARRHRC